MVSIRKRGAVYGVIALMLCTAVYLNWSYVKTPDDMLVAGQTDVSEEEAGKIFGEAKLVDGSAETEATAVNSGDYFAESRLSRQKARDEAISILKKTVDNPSSSEKDKTQANEKISELAENSVKESRVESLIKAKGYKEVVVFLNDKGVTIIVSTPQAGFSAADAAKIKDVVIGETGANADDIKITEAA